MIQELQKRQFNIKPSAQGSNAADAGKSLFELQKEADKYTADITIYEGLQKINKDYKDFIQANLKIGDEEVDVARTLADYDSLISNLVDENQFQKFNNLHTMNNLFNLIENIDSQNYQSLNMDDAAAASELKAFFKNELIAKCELVPEGASGYEECQFISKPATDLVTGFPAEYHLVENFLDAYVRDYRTHSGRFIRFSTMSNKERVDELRKKLNEGITTEALAPEFHARVNTQREALSARLQDVRQCHSSVVKTSADLDTKCREMLTPNESGVTPILADVNSYMSNIENLTENNIPDEAFDEVQDLLKKRENIVERESEKRRENQLLAVNRLIKNKQKDMLSLLDAHLETLGKYGSFSTLLGEEPEEVAKKGDLLTNVFKNILGEEYCSENSGCSALKADGEINENLLLKFLQKIQEEDGAKAFAEMESQKDRLGELLATVSSIQNSQEYKDLEAMKSAMLVDAKASCPNKEGDTEFFAPTNLASCINHLNPGHTNDKILLLNENISVITNTAITEQNYSAAYDACQSMANRIQEQRSSMTEEQRRNSSLSYQGQYGEVCNRIGELHRGHVQTVRQRAIASVAKPPIETNRRGRQVHRFYDDKGEEIGQYVEPNNLAILGVASAKTFQKEGPSMILGLMHNKYALPNYLDNQVQLGIMQKNQFAWNDSFYNSPYYMDYMMNPASFNAFGPGLFYDPVTAGVSKSYGNVGYDFGQ
tara:strand:- start:34889 stop:37033 length:2145 start_codon:yes stop_codon:yes gene_type:complete